MKKKVSKKIILVVIALAISGGGAYYYISNKPTAGENALVEELQEEVEATQAKIKGETVIITYNQSMQTEDQAELFGTWAYILGVATQEAPEAETIVVECVFEDKQKATITASRQTVHDFLEEKISAVEFLQLITVEASSKGPEI